MGDIISVLDYVVKEFKEYGKLSVVNLSLGGGVFFVMDKVVVSVVRSGVIVVVVVGNEVVSFFLWDLCLGGRIVNIWIEIGYY